MLRGKFPFVPLLLFVMTMLQTSCATTPPPDPGAFYRECLWGEIGSLPESLSELLQTDKPAGPETLRYLKAYDLEPSPGAVSSFNIRLGLLREGQRYSGQGPRGQGIRGNQAPSGGIVETRGTNGSGDLQSLGALPPLCTLPSLGVLVGVPGKGSIHPSPKADPFRSITAKPAWEGGPGEQSEEHLIGYRGAYLRGTVFLVHGYLDHSGSWAPVIKRILREGYMVIALDLPGHGFSGGKRGDIEDFSLYGEAVRRVVEWAMKVSPPQPWIAIGHSTGASAIWIALVRTLIEDGCGSPQQGKVPIQKGPGPLQAGGGTVAERGNVGETIFYNVLFLAPLVRSAHWRLSMTLVSLTRWAIPYWKSRTAIDPLFPIPYFPVHWAEKLKNWESKVHEYPSIHQKGWILQGTSDEVVDHSYSIPFLRSKLPGFRVRYIEGAGHVPYLRTPSGERYVQEVLEALSGFPEESP